MRCRAKLNLLQHWETSLAEFRPARLWRRGFSDGEAVLYWGKAALETWKELAPARRRLQHPGPELVIHPADGGLPDYIVKVEDTGATRFVSGEHPLPGPGSFEAGKALLEFFDLLARQEVRRLTVFLSGGASSLAWLSPLTLSEAELHERLAALYRQPLTIAQLNSARSELCALKAGGAARGLHKISPRTRARVFVISDVLPYGPEIVGSGPFWERDAAARPPHQVLADNRSWVRALTENAVACGIPLLHAESGQLGEWRGWVRKSVRLLGSASRAGKAGLILLGGEPQVSLRGARRGRGGRQTQIALGILRECHRNPALRELLRARRVEILCASSDGLDGASGSAGAWLSPDFLSRLFNAKHGAKLSARKLDDALRDFDSATFLASRGIKHSVLIPARATGTNVQDIVMIRIR